MTSKNSLRSPLSLTLILFFCSLSLLQVHCIRKSGEENLSVYHGSEKDDVKTWDPANAYDTVSLDLVPLIYETLYQYSYLSDSYQVEPLLANELPTFSPDYLTVTIPIKKGIKFQDDPAFKETQGQGRELKAKDFVYAWKRLALPSLQSQGWWILDKKIVGINAFHEQLLKASKAELPAVFERNVEGIQAIDDYTLQIKLLKPYPQLLSILSMNFTSPVPKEAVETYADERGNLTDHPVGTGPFVLKKWSRNHEIILERSPGFRKDPYPNNGAENFRSNGLLADAGKPMPFLDRISMEIMKEDQPRWLTFLKGKLDSIPLPKDNFKQAIIDQVNLTPDFLKKGIRLSIESGVVIRTLSFNMRDNLLGSNKYLRQAISSAIDRNEWMSLFTNGTGRKMVNAIPPGIPDRPSTDHIKYDFNLEVAKELLKKAGYPSGKGLPPLKFDLRGASTTDRQLGDFIAAQLAQIGIRVEVVPNTFPAFLEKMKQGNLQLSYGGWALDYPDAENIYQLLYGPNQAPGPNDANYDNPQFNQLYEKMEVLHSGRERAQLIQSMDDILQEDCPWVLGYYEVDYHLTQPWLLNYRGNPIILNKLKYLRVNSEIKRRYLEGT